MSQGEGAISKEMLSRGKSGVIDAAMANIKCKDFSWDDFMVEANAEARASTKW